MKKSDRIEMEAHAEAIYAEMSRWFDPQTGEYTDEYEGPLSENAGSGGFMAGSIRQVAADADAILALVRNES